MWWGGGQQIINKGVETYQDRCRGRTYFSPSSPTSIALIYQRWAAKSITSPQLPSPTGLKPIKDGAGKNMWWLICPSAKHVLPLSSRNSPTTCSGYFRKLSKKLSKKLAPKCFRKVSEKFPKSFRKVSEKFPKTFQKLFRNFLETFWKVFGNFLETFLKLFGKL